MAFVYIMRCDDGTYSTGSTKKTPEQREWEHNNDDLHSVDCARRRRPVHLVYTECFDEIERAYARERQLHGWSHRKKEALINGWIDELQRLSRSRNVSRETK